MLDVTPEGRVSHVLTNLGEALQANDIERAVALFQADGYWRDLVAFTWNIRTHGGQRGDSRDARRRGSPTPRPRHSPWTAKRATADGITEAWFTFETRVARGRGHLAAQGRQGLRRLLTTMVELKGHEEHKGTRRVKGAEHGVHPGRTSWLERRADEQARLGYEEQPHVLIIGGGQGGIVLAARLRRLGVPTIVVEKNEKPGDSWRKRYKCCACTIRSGTTTCPTCRSRTTGRCSRPRTRSATGSRCTPR